MNQPQITNFFADLAQHPFAGVRTGAFKQINEPDVTAVLGSELSPVAKKYANSIDIDHLVGCVGEERHGLFATAHKRLSYPLVIERHDIAQDIERQIGAYLPKAPGKRKLLSEMAEQFGEMSDAFKDRMSPHGVPYSGKVILMFTAKTPTHNIGVLHGDAGSDLQGFLTIKGQGSIGASPRVRHDIHLPGSEPDREDPHRSRKGLAYGYPTMGFAEVLRQVPAQRAAVWQGVLNKDFFIHSEPDIVTPEQSRLVAIVRPYENSGYYKP